MLGRSPFSSSEDETFSRKHLSLSPLTHRGYDESTFWPVTEVGEKPFFPFIYCSVKPKRRL